MVTFEGTLRTSSLELVKFHSVEEASSSYICPVEGGRVVLLTQPKVVN